MAGPFALINPFLISLCKRLTNLVSIKNPYFSFNGNYLTRREQEVPHLYRWWDELRITQHFLLCTANCCYDIPTSFY